LQFIRDAGNPAEIHIACALACSEGIEYVLRAEPKASICCGDIDEELTAKGYIVPGLGDAGDLAYGVKVQM
jgi:uracil phosphoribosyltransferase